MTQILENLDLSEELKSELTESFDKAVLVEAVKLAESKEAEYEEYMTVQMTEMKTDLEDKLDEYLTRVVEEFVEDNTFAIDESIQTEKYEAIMEGFNSLLITSGVELTQIAEAKEISDEENAIVEGELEEVNAERADRLMEEVMELKGKNAELLKTGLIKESMETMTELQKDKFLKLASIVEFDATNPVSFIGKLDTLAESVSGEKVEVVEEITEKVIVEKVDAKDWSQSSSHLF